jgi:excisionase family DNA binding protein
MGPNPEGFATQLLPVGGVRLRGLRGGRDGRLLTVAEVAEELAVSTATVYELVRRRALPSVRALNAIRVRREELDAFVKGSGFRAFPT